MMKDKILEYIKLNPNLTYHDLCKIFGLSLEGIFKMLDINNYKIEDGYIEIFDTNDNSIYEEFSTGYWVKYEYDENNNRICVENYKGSWVKYYYDGNNNLTSKEDSNGYKYKY